MPAADQSWDAHHQAYLRFLETEGRPPSVGATGSEYTLARWFSNQRITLASSTTAQSEERRRLLSETVPHWDKKRRSRAPWESRFEVYLEYRRQHGHDPTSRSGDKRTAVLGRWIDEQRVRARRGQLLPERRAALDAMNPLWLNSDVNTSAWEAKVDALAAFRAKHGRDPSRREDAVVAKWLSTCRTEDFRGALSAQRGAQLDAVNPNWRRPDSGRRHTRAAPPGE